MTMTDSERITALEARLAKAEARIAELEGRMPLGAIGPNPGPGTPIWPDPLPGWPLPPPVTCGPDGPVAIKPEKDNGERSGSSSGVPHYRHESTVGAENPATAISGRWLGTV